MAMTTTKSNITDSETTLLQETVATTIGVDTDNIEDFTVIVTAARRRHRRLLADYTWDVSFEVVTSLSTTLADSATSFAEIVESTLTADLATNVASAGIATVTVETIATVVATRRPSSQPTQKPFPSPTSSPEASVAASSSGADSSTPASDESPSNSSATIIGASVAGAALLLVAIGVAVWYSRRTKVGNGNGDEIDWQANQGVIKGELMRRKAADESRRSSQSSPQPPIQGEPKALPYPSDIGGHSGKSVFMPGTVPPPRRASKALPSGTRLPPISNASEAKARSNSTHL